MIAALTFVALSTVIFFPWATDKPATAPDTEAQREFYAKAYAASKIDNSAAPDPSKHGAGDTEYIDSALGQHHAAGTKPKLARFLEEKGLTKARGLDIGSGVGYLQDVMEDYTGLDISTSVARYYTKPFVLGSATALPFKDNEFDVVISFYTYEHVPNPEQALREARRVVKSGGYLYLEPAWSCSPLAPQGYRVRPFSDFGLEGKVIKAVEPVYESSVFRATHVIPARILRSLVALTGPTTLHYSRITPNYTTYWMSDSDAVNNIDRLEAALWFKSRGDECLNCDTPASLALFRRANEPRLIIRVKK